MSRPFLLSLVAVTLLDGGISFDRAASGQSPAVQLEKGKPSIDRLASELPRVAPQAPAESLEAM